MRLRVVKLRPEEVGAQVGPVAHKSRVRLGLIASRCVLNKPFRREGSHNPSMLKFTADDEDRAEWNWKWKLFSTNW